MASTKTGQRSSSPQQDTKSSSDVSRASSFTFLLQSQEALNSNLPPDVDSSQPAARQKRRRTSPEDSAILETEYEKNPKPDKAARAEIVKRVALGDKEVQIWFQNRRQMTRRKSHPPSLPGINSVPFSSQESLGTSAYSSCSLSDGSQPDPVSSQTSYTRTKPAITGNEDVSLGEKLEQKVDSASAFHDGPSASAAEAPLIGRQPESTSEDVGRAPRESGTKASLRNLESTVLAKHGLNTLGRRRRSSPFDIHPDQDSESPSSAARADALPVGKTIAPDLLSTVRRTSSLIRLSTSLDGKAKVAIGNSPSPPKLRAPRPVGGLQRSQSAIEPNNKAAADATFPIVKPQKTSMPGRSRDARTWEFYCDSSARDALTEQAEREQNGSAVGAIGLMRSRSNKALASNPNKRNARPEKNEAIKRLKADDKEAQKRKLNRTQSSVARLQTVNNSSQKQNVSHKEQPGKPTSQLELDHSGDSDKENWEPGTQSRTQRRTRNTNAASSSRTGRSVLKESLIIPSQSSSLDALMDRENAAPRQAPAEQRIVSDAQQHAEKYKDEEVADFMSGSRSPREADELDCVQNLLSLSQGHWQ